MQQRRALECIPCPECFITRYNVKRSLIDIIESWNVGAPRFLIAVGPENGGGGVGDFGLSRELIAVQVLLSNNYGSMYCHKPLAIFIRADGLPRYHVLGAVAGDLYTGVRASTCAWDSSQCSVRPEKITSWCPHKDLLRAQSHCGVIFLTNVPQGYVDNPLCSSLPPP